MKISDIFKIELTRLFLFVLFCLLVAAVISPWLYENGRELAASIDKNQYPDFISKAINSTERASFGRYFKRAMQLTALVFLYPFISSLKSKTKTIKPPLRIRLNPKAQGYRHLLYGFLFAAGSMAIFIAFTAYTGWSEITPSTNPFSAISSAITTAIIISLIEEWLFRGVIFSLLLRSLRPNHAMIGLSFFFAALHFIDSPSQFATPITTPLPNNAGIIYLGSIFEKFLHPSEFFGVFLTLFAVGMVLVYAKHRTGYLWLSIGIHAGWVFCMKSYISFFETTGNAPPLLFGNDMREGLVPLLFIGITQIAVFFYLRPKPSRLRAK